MKIVRPVIPSNAVPYLQMGSLGSHSKSGRGKEGKKEKMGRDHRRSAAGAQGVAQELAAVVCVSFFKTGNNTRSQEPTLSYSRCFCFRQLYCVDHKGQHFPAGEILKINNNKDIHS